MFYGDNVQDTRKIFFDSWRKFQTKEALNTLEQQLVAVIIDHPEYHHLLENAANLQQKYFPELGESNPFLHMGLHLAIRDQVSLDKPMGIRQVHQLLLQHYKDNLAVEHLMIDCLAECLWSAQRTNQMPDEQRYLQACKRLAGF